MEDGNIWGENQLLGRATKESQIIKNGDVIGIKIDLEIGTFQVTINGKDAGKEVYLNELK